MRNAGTKYLVSLAAVFLFISTRLPASGTADLPSSTREGRTVREEAENAEIYSQTERKKALLSVLLLGVPLVGHVTPLLALGEELVRRGHKVTLSTSVAEGAPNKPEEMARRAGVGFMSAGPSSYEAQLLVTDEAYKMKIVKDEGFITKTFRVSDLTVGVNIVMAEHINNISSGGGVFQWDIVVGVEYLYPLLACIQKRWNVLTVVLNTKLQQQWHTLPHWPFPSSGAQTDDLTFSQRLQNQIWGPLMHIFNKLWTIRRIKNGAKEMCQSSSVDYMLTAPSDYLPQIIPSSIGFEYPRTISPLAEYVGPLKTRITQTIPMAMGTWLDSKQPGSVIYISMGSLFPITKAVASALVSGVLATNHSALWSLRKSNYDLVMQGIGEVDESRILIVDWVPQIAVLQHRAVGLAILHGGMSGLHEAMAAGVPMILIPLSSDQFSTSSRVQQSGAATVLSFRSISAEKISESIRRVNSVDYREAARKMGRIFQQAGGVEKAASLVELYADVGYEHLIPAYAHYQWSWIQCHNVDVMAALLVSAVVVLYATVFVSSRLITVTMASTVSHN